MHITTRHIVGLLTTRGRGMGDLPVDPDRLSAPVFKK
jgi:hypothetical protein